MNGILFFRKKQHRTRKHVADLAGLCEPTVKKMEHATERIWPCWYYMALAEVLGVHVEELIAEYPDSMLLPGDHFVRESVTCHPENTLAGFKKAHNLNFEQMAVLLGLGSREAARRACRNRIPKPEHVSKLASLKGISEKEFGRRYGRSDE